MKSVPICEQETTIQISRDSDTARIYSCDPTVMSKLSKLCQECPDDYKVIRSDEYGNFYDVTKKLIRFCKPATEARREAGRNSKLALRNKASATEIKDNTAD